MKCLQSEYRISVSIPRIYRLMKGMNLPKMSTVKPYHNKHKVSGDEYCPNILRQHRIYPISKCEDKKFLLQAAKGQNYVRLSAARHTESDRQRFSVSQIQIRQCEHDINFGSLFSQTSISSFTIPKNILHHCEDVFHLAADR